jgi:hypothetical protein
LQIEEQTRDIINFFNGRRIKSSSFLGKW